MGGGGGGMEQKAWNEQNKWLGWGFQVYDEQNKWLGWAFQVYDEQNKWGGDEGLSKLTRNETNANKTKLAMKKVLHVCGAERPRT